MQYAQDLISVVIPLYNKAPYIERAVRSALAQGEAVREVIVVDDGSTDNSAEIVERMQAPKVRLIRKPNGGVSSTRNRGIDEAVSDYICFLDADDVYMDGFVEEIVRLMRLFPDADLLATSIARVWPDGRRVEAALPKSVDANNPQILSDIYQVFSRSSIFSISSSACVRRQTLMEKEICFPAGESVGEDQDVIFRLAEVGKVAFSPKCLAEYTQGVENSLYGFVPGYLPPFCDRLSARLKSGACPEHHRSGARRLLSVYRLNMARIIIERGQRWRALRYLFHPNALCHFVYWLRTAVRISLPAIFFKNRWTRRI